MLGGEYFDKLVWVHDKIKADTMLAVPRLMNASIKINLQCPSIKIIDGFCRLVVPGKLAALASIKKRELVDEGEQLIEDCSKLVKDNEVPTDIAVHLLGMLDVRVIGFIPEMDNRLKART